MAILSHLFEAYDTGGQSVLAAALNEPRIEVHRTSAE